MNSLSHIQHTTHNTYIINRMKCQWWNNFLFLISNKKKIKLNFIHFLDKMLLDISHTPTEHSFDIYIFHCPQLKQKLKKKLKRKNHATNYVLIRLFNVFAFSECSTCRIWMFNITRSKQNINCTSFEIAIVFQLHSHHETEHTWAFVWHWNILNIEYTLICVS